MRASRNVVNQRPWLTAWKAANAIAL